MVTALPEASEDSWVKLMSKSLYVVSWEPDAAAGGPTNRTQEDREEAELEGEPLPAVVHHDGLEVDLKT